MKLRDYVLLGLKVIGLTILLICLSETESAWLRHLIIAIINAGVVYVLSKYLNSKNNLKNE